MDICLDELCRRISARAGVVPDFRVPEIPKDLLFALDGHSPASLIRVVQAGPVEALVLSLPPGFGQRGPGPTRPAESADRISRTISYICTQALPQRQWGRLAVVCLRQGWPEPHLIASCIEVNPMGLPKFAVLPGDRIEDALDRVPAFAKLWEITRPSNPTWLSAIGAEGRVGPLSEVDLHPKPGPGLTVLMGGYATGKSTLVASIIAAAAGDSSAVSVEFTDGTPRAGATGHSPGAAPSRDLSQEADRRMQPFRRMMGYGAPDGSLFLPIALEGHAFQSFERVGRALLACAEAADLSGTWPGLLLDVPLGLADEIRKCRLAEAVVLLARERQVVVTARDTNEARLWKMIADDLCVPCSTVDLRGGQAIQEPGGIAPSTQWK